MLLEFVGLGLIRKGEAGDEFPRAVFGGVWRTALIVFGEAGFQVGACADIGLIRRGIAADQIDAVHRNYAGDLEMQALLRPAGSASQAAGMPTEALAKAGGGEGTRTPVRNAFSDGIYTFSRRS